MKFVQRVLGKNRIRSMRQELAKNPTPGRYAALARECVQLGKVQEARRVCEEGLEVFSGNAELQRLAQRATKLEREERLTQLKRELRDAPRPALWNEMCAILLGSGQVAQAEEFAREWYEATDDPGAQLVYAQTLLERFLTDRGREVGRKALEVIDEVEGKLTRDPRPWRLRLELTSKIGAWKEARRCCAQLLGLQPGDPALEARFRAFDGMSDDAPSIGQALLRVERTGQLAQEGKASNRVETPSTDVRPALRRLAGDPGVHAAIYLRGGTALVQGVRGATANRTARAVRSIVKASHTASRRLGLGQIAKIQFEGDFGALTLAPGEMDAGALWSQGKILPEIEQQLMGLAGLDAEMQRS